MNNLSDLEKKLSITFKQKKILENVFIHRSYLNEHKNFYLPSNEKLEFLGDSVLSLVTSLFLYQNYVWLKEGDYTEIKAAIVRTESLAYAAKLLKLGDYLLLSKGQDRESGRKNKKNKQYLSPKSKLQEYTQAKFKLIPTYKLIEEIGPEHDRIFKVEVAIKQKKYGFGYGKSKKEAEEKAAKEALEEIK